MPIKYSLLIVSLCAIVLSGCGGGSKRNSQLQDLKPYLETSQYKDKLVFCVRATKGSQSCKVSDLPPLGMETPNPSIDDIMARVVVSHTWMGDNFRQLLEVLPEDMYALFGAVTAVVIDGDVRPSYYWSLTGAIYLDPFNLWLQADEKNVISRKEDYRAGYADPMSFRAFWRMTLNGGEANNYYSLDYPGSRSVEDIVIPMASLLFHELAHANDIFPASQYATVRRDLSIAQATSSLYDSYPSTVLSAAAPLSSQEMFNIANILFLGATPSDADKLITAEQVGGYFEPDAANDDYAYSSQYEDLAMLFEESMLKIHYNVDRDVAFVVAPGANASCDDYKIGWGVRNRLGAEQVKVRAEQAVNALLPTSDYSAFFAQLNAPQALPVGAGWCEILSANQVQSNKSGVGAETERDTARKLRPDNVTRPYDLLF